MWQLGMAQQTIPSMVWTKVLTPLEVFKDQNPVCRLRPGDLKVEFDEGYWTVYGTVTWGCNAEMEDHLRKIRFRSEGDENDPGTIYTPTRGTEIDYLAHLRGRKDPAVANAEHLIQAQQIYLEPAFVPPGKNFWMEVWQDSGIDGWLQPMVIESPFIAGRRLGNI